MKTNNKKKKVKEPTDILEWITYILEWIYVYFNDRNINVKNIILKILIVLCFSISVYFSIYGIFNIIAFIAQGTQQYIPVDYTPFIYATISYLFCLLTAGGLFFRENSIKLKTKNIENTKIMNKKEKEEYINNLNLNLCSHEDIGNLFKEYESEKLTRD